MHDEDGWKRTVARRHRAIRGDLAAFDRDFDFAGYESVAVGRDSFGRHRHHGQREAGCETSHHEFTTRELSRHIFNFCKPVSWNAREFRA